MKDLKIRFDVDVEKKIVSIYFNNKEMEEWVARAMKEFPKLTESGKLANKGAEFIAMQFADAFDKICKMQELNMDDFTMDAKMYDHPAELPLALRQIS